MASRAGRIKKNSTASPRHSRRASSEDDHIVNDVLMKERIRTVSVSRATTSSPLVNVWFTAGSRSMHAKNKIRCAKKS